MYHILAHWECGVFDGGCLMLAVALQRMLSGSELYGIWGIPKRFPTEQDADRHPQKSACQHALVSITPNFFMDGDGISASSRLLDRWEREELVDVRGLLALDPQQMQSAPFEEKTIDQMTDFLMSDAINWHEFGAYLQEVKAATTR